MIRWWNEGKPINLKPTTTNEQKTHKDSDEANKYDKQTTG